jgi:hypothetical protein
MNPDRRPEAERGGIHGVGGFFLHHLIEHFPEGVTRRSNHGERFAGHVDEVEFWRIGGLGKGIDLRGLLHFGG